MSEKTIKALAIKVKPTAEPPGVEYKWDRIPQINRFTQDIVIPEIAAEKDGTSKVNIGTIVSGMPTVFARANLFKKAIENVTDKNAETSGLMLLYKSLFYEWRGLIACLALNYKDLNVERIYLQYSDGKDLMTTKNVYEPIGAFGNVLFERKPLWCDQGLSSNSEKIPFIDVISYKNEVVGGTSPDSLLFTSVSYQIREKASFVNVGNGKFIDPLKSDIQPLELNVLYGYVNRILNNLDKFRKNFDSVEDFLKPNYSSINGNLKDWLKEMDEYAASKKWPKIIEQPPELTSFKYPFGILFNNITELYGSEGTISTDATSGSIPFDPRNLLLPETTEIAQIRFGPDAEKNSNFLIDRPLMLLKAEIKDMANSYAYFTLPLTPLALNIFGANLNVLVGMDQGSAIKSRLSAIYDPNDTDGEKLIVNLNLVTQNGSNKPIVIKYNVGREIKGQDILLWPNFISKQWNRYFMFSEIPHNDTGFQATPFIGDTNDSYFRIVMNQDGVPLYLSENGKINKLPEQFKAKILIGSNIAVADNKYKYEIYESNQPFKGLKFSYANKDCGFAIIRYDKLGTQVGLPKDKLSEPIKELSPAFLGADFGSTNTSIAYWSDTKQQVCDKIILKNRRISLLSSDLKNNDERSAVEDEIFFFQNDEITTNSIKSVLAIHDPKRIVNDSNTELDSLTAKEIIGGFPCFEKNIPIETAKDNRYILNFNRVGIAELVYNMKWSKQRSDKSNKSAYLGSLLLHIYAQLFEEDHEPVTLKWSYPSSMGKDLLNDYLEIWKSVCSISPINNGKKLDVYSPSDLSDLGDTSASPSWGNADATDNNTNTSGGWGSASDSGGGWGAEAAPKSNGWGDDASKKQKPTVDIQVDSGPLEFDFKELSNTESLTEACAVANYLVNDGGYTVKPDELLLCFDIGGSTTDISVLCQMDGGKAMIKQNSIRFAAQRISNATKYSPNFKSVLLKVCERKKIKIEGLNNGPVKFNENTAPFYFEQVIDRLNEADFDDFYRLIAADCKEMMSVNLYVTGLIMYYAGQLAFKLRNEIVRMEDVPPSVKAKPPKINIAFAGKGARIFDWFNAVNEKAANDYYTQMFIRGIGGIEVAKQIITPINFQNNTIININARKKEFNADLKYEVSKGLAIPTYKEKILVPKNKQAIEILGEEGFCIYGANGEMQYLNYGNSITPEMMENIGTYFMSSPQTGQPPCPKFMDFADLYYKVAQSMFGLKISPNDFLAGFNNMNIESYIKNDPDYVEAQKRKVEQKKFDYVAPIIILEGMKFFEDVILKGIK